MRIRIRTKMSVQFLTYLFVGLTFALYIGIAFWVKPKIPILCGEGVHPVANGIAAARLIGCQLPSFISILSGLLLFWKRWSSLSHGGQVDMFYLHSFTCAIFEKVRKIYCARIYRNPILF